MVVKSRLNTATRQETFINNVVVFLDDERDVMEDLRPRSIAIRRVISQPFSLVLLLYFKVLLAVESLVLAQQITEEQPPHKIATRQEIC